MGFNEIVKLLDAGFTREEIMRFMSTEKQAEKLVEKPAEKLAEKPIEKPAEKPAENVALGEILAEMKNVVAEIQKANMFRASLPGPGDGDNVDNILASIINPRKETT